ncbi:MAG: hypothetical protein AAB490_04340, partial [Patescibacteria group bacterium]
MRRIAVMISLLMFIAISHAFAQSPRVPPGLERRLNIEAHGLRAVRTMSDVDMLSDGRIAILDNDAMRVGIFTAAGVFEHWLDSPRGIPPADTLLTRLVALPEGGLVLADWKGNRFFFYDKELRPQEPIPFGRQIVSVNGFVRHPSGDLYLVGYCLQNGKILHRFDATGQYLSSAVASLDLPPQQQGLSTGYLAVDPLDGTLWLSRLTPYEILHLSVDGMMLQDPITRGPGTLPQTEAIGYRSFPYLNFDTALKIAVIGDTIV